MALEEAILTISVAAKLLNIHPRTIMLYERTKLFSPHRTTTQRRMFSATDLESLQFIKYLTQKKSINLQGVKILLEALAVAESKGINLKQHLFPDFKVEKLFRFIH
jgi:MerR family transcriptional regulator/heat shock protein HspR